MMPPALAFYLSLSDAQRVKATLAPTDPDRTLEQFPHDPRCGLALRELSPESDARLLPLLQSACSQWGAVQARAIMDQPRGGYPNYHVAFYGEPTVYPFDRAGMEWRLSGHHLTLFGFTDPWTPVRVGPLLLGADPATLWTAEEAAVAALQRTLTALPSKVRDRLKGARGVPVADLPEPARQECAAWLDERLKVYAPTIVEAANRLHESGGGLQAAHLHFDGDASQPSAQGGRYYALLVGPSLNFWIDTRAGHPHMLLDISGPAGT